MKKIFLQITICFVAVVSLRGQFPDNENLAVLHGPYIQNLGENGVTIIWETNRPAVPSVLLGWGEGQTREIRNSHDGLFDAGGTLHRVRIEGLEPGMEYSYETLSTQILKYQAYRIYRGDTLKSGTRRFKTLDGRKDETRFTVFNDIHGNSAMLAGFLRNIDREKQDLFFMNGDAVDYIQEPGQLYRGFLDSAVTCFAGEKPLFMVRGNHETRGMMARSFKDYFDFPGGRYYYAFTDGPVRFIVLDCGEDKPDNNRYYYGMADFDRYRLEEAEWLKAEAAGEAFSQAAFRVVIIHMPVYDIGESGHGMSFLAENLGPVLEKAGIDLMISGHTHRTAWIEAGDNGFGYPVAISSNRSYTEVLADRSALQLRILDRDGRPVISRSIKK